MRLRSKGGALLWSSRVHEEFGDACYQIAADPTCSPWS